ncbi:MAG: VWA domain-containing protein [Phycisphaerae bacterium]
MLREPSITTATSQHSGSSAQPLAHESLTIVGSGGISGMLEAVFPWAASCSVHIGTGLILMFAIYAARADTAEDERTAVAPIMFNGGVQVTTPDLVRGTGLGDDASRQALQNKFPNEGNPNGWASEKGADEIAKALGTGAGSGDQITDMIAGGSGGNINGKGNGNGGGRGGILAPYGEPDGGNNRIPTIYPAPAREGKIVYILDHSGSMVDNFDFLRQQTLKSVENLIPLQSFAVIMYAEDITVLGPDRVVPAVKANKEMLRTRMDQVRAAGFNDDQLEPYEKAFRKAFAMKPDQIFFLTDGAFDPKLAEIVTTLNKDQKVSISTLAFIKEDPRYNEQLHMMADENRGTYRLVKAKDLN